MVNRIIFRCNNLVNGIKRLKNFSEYRRYVGEETEQVRFFVDGELTLRLRLLYFILCLEAILTIEPILTVLIIPVIYFRTLVELPAFSEYGLLHLMRVNTDFGVNCMQQIGLNIFKAVIFVSALITLAKFFYGGLFEWFIMLGIPKYRVKVIKAKGNKELSEVLIGNKLVKIKVVNDNLLIIGLELKWSGDSLVLKKI